ncbi:DnaB-like helicase N-terminal domain-containing protein [Hydrogenimonas thermophila]|uniref:AAA domain-containing protein n=1 Tax=Hydrogenimonas thermophila TaxID=223786 RepID=A0A1I5UWW1_9BACT|nr:DnaB-like helicase N-terminal domain-containing protein [Hydrogenimonas thermophila]SFP99186.1 AAA domain-containing protein [Hydrogenimonas thermophila]
MLNVIITNNLYNINIERAVLCTAVFEPTKFEEIAVQLKADDFYHPFHQNLFTAMEELHKNDQPIDEEFLREKLAKKNQFNEVAFLDVLSANPLSNINAYINQIKQKAKNRKMLYIVAKIKHKIEAGESNAAEVAAQIMANVDSMFVGTDIEVYIAKAKYKQAILQKIKKLKKLKESEFVELEEEKIYDEVIEKLENKIGINQKKEWDDSFDEWLDSIDMDPDEVENKKVEYVIQNLVVKNGITVFFGPSGGGKSTGVIGISYTALLDGTIKRVIYLDLDNGDTTIQERKIHELKRILRQRLRYISQDENKVWRMIKELLKRDLHDTMIVFDSAKNFMKGKDRDKNKDVSELTEVFKRLRNNGATIIALHHTNKPNQEMDEYEQVYAGSSAWREDVDNMFLLVTNKYKNTFIFVPSKNRVGIIEEQAYKIENHIIEKVETEWAKEDAEFEEIRDQVISFIEDCKTPPTFSQILTFLIESGYSKNKSNKVIQKGKGRYWKIEKIKKNNKNLYFLIQPEEAETKFKVVEFEKKNKASSDKCDKSDKSYFRDFSKSDNCGQVRTSVDKNYVYDMKNNYSKKGYCNV